MNLPESVGNTKRVGTYDYECVLQCVLLASRNHGGSTMHEGRSTIVSLIFISGQPQHAYTATGAAPYIGQESRNRPQCTRPPREQREELFRPPRPERWSPRDTHTAHTHAAGHTHTSISSSTQPSTQPRSLAVPRPAPPRSFLAITHQITDANTGPNTLTHATSAGRGDPHHHTHTRSL